MEKDEAKHLTDFKTAGKQPLGLVYLLEAITFTFTFTKASVKSVSLSLNPPKGGLAGEGFGVEGNGSLLSRCAVEREIGPPSKLIVWERKGRNYFFTNLLELDQ